MRTRIIVGALVVLGLVVAGAAGWVFFGRGWLAAREDARVADVLRADPRTAETFATIERRTADIAQRPDDVELYISVGNGWKAVADLTGDPSYYRRAEDWYGRGIDVSGGTNTIIMQNLAVVLRLDKRPEEAEQVLRRAIEVNAGDPNLYVQLVDLMRIDLGRSHTDIVDVYRMGIDRLVDNAPLVQSLAGYLEDVGRLPEALTYYELLAAKYPGFEDKIAELKRTIASQP